MNRSYNVTFSNGQTWSIPVAIIALNRARYFRSKEPEMNLEDHLIAIYKEFDEDKYLIEEWARNNMNWSDVSNFAVLQEEEKYINWEREWCNPEKIEIINE